MKVGDVAETITVTGATPIVDVQNTRGQNVLTRAVLDTLPTARSIAAMAAITLGAQATGQALGGGDAGGSRETRSTGSRRSMAPSRACARSTACG